MKMVPRADISYLTLRKFSAASLLFLSRSVGRRVQGHFVKVLHSGIGFKEDTKRRFMKG
jgi:nucleoid-associated protein YejK